MGGSLTEIVYALGAENRLIARDTTSHYPPDATKLPDVGYMRNLSPEGVLSLSPDGILLIEGSGPPSTIEILAHAEVPMVIIPEHFTQNGVIQKILKVGQALHQNEQAKKLTDRIEYDFSENDKLLNKITQAKRVSPKRILFVMTIQNGRIMAAGKNTAADGMIALSGGTNAVTDYDGYKLINDEAIINAAPDFILMMSHAGSTTTIDQVLALPAIQMTPAGKNKAVIQMDGLYLLSFGPRTASAARDVINVLYKDEL
ncbi:MAG: ABC transporter substrate-binding protein [Bartonella sp.]|nr:ABC transporter substrate-binding protein [Bartonella sp.]